MLDDIFGDKSDEKIDVGGYYILGIYYILTYGYTTLIRQNLYSS